MKGMVFTEFMEMVEDIWSLDMVDRLLEHAGVTGAYTAVGNYPSEELLAVMNALSNEVGQPLEEIMQSFGARLFTRFARNYPSVLLDMDNGFQFLARIEDVIHTEVRKLYPDVELPSFEVAMRADTLELAYFSTQPFADLVLGFLEGCMHHFGEPARIAREAPVAGSGAQARFIVQRMPSA